MPPISERVPGEATQSTITPSGCSELNLTAGAISVHQEKTRSFFLYFKCKIAFFWVI